MSTVVAVFDFFDKGDALSRARCKTSAPPHASPCSACCHDVVYRPVTITLNKTRGKSVVLEIQERVKIIVK